MGHSATADARDERLEQHTLFSRRHARRRPQPQGQYRLPDWIWGLGLGLVILLIIGGFFVITNLGGSGGSTCDNELPRLPGTVEVSAEGVQQEDEALAGAIAFLRR